MNDQIFLFLSAVEHTTIMGLFTLLWRTFRLSSRDCKYRLDKAERRISVLQQYLISQANHNQPHSHSEEWKAVEEFLEEDTKKTV